MQQCINQGEFVENGGTGSTWCGGYGGGGRTVDHNGYSARVSTSGGTIVCYGHLIKGTGFVLANGTIGHGAENMKWFEATKVWGSNSMAGGSGGGCIVALNVSEDANIKVSSNGGGNPSRVWIPGNILAGKGGLGSIRLNWKTE